MKTDICSSLFRQARLTILHLTAVTLSVCMMTGSLSAEQTTTATLPQTSERFWALYESYSKKKAEALRLEQTAYVSEPSLRLASEQYHSLNNNSRRDVLREKVSNYFIARRQTGDQTSDRMFRRMKILSGHLVLYEMLTRPDHAAIVRWMLTDRQAIGFISDSEVVGQYPDGNLESADPRTAFDWWTKRTGQIKPQMLAELKSIRQAAGFPEYFEEYARLDAAEEFQRVIYRQYAEALAPETLQADARELKWIVTEMTEVWPGWKEATAEGDPLDRGLIGVLH